MFDYSRLRGKIAEKNMTQETLSNKLKIAKSTLNLKINNKIAFSQEDIVSISAILEIPKEEIGPYFFTEKV